MNPDKLLNHDLNNTYQFETPRDSNHCDTSSDPRQVTTRATDNPKNIPVLPNMIIDKISIRKFSGYSHEDADIFLLNSTVLLHFMDLHQDLEQSHVRKIASFHVHLAGLAQIWFYPFPSTEKKSWDSLIEKFREQYVPTNTAYEPALNPRL